MIVEINIDPRGQAATRARLEALEANLRDRAGLNKELAGTGESFLQEYVSSIPDHKTAEKLGATPTGHLAITARGIEGQSDADGARILIPRRSRLRAAFGTYTVKPGPGKTWLTIPASARTYGKRAGEIGEKLHYQIVDGKFPALCFEDGSTAYWLRREVTIQQDPTLIPFKLLADELADAGGVWLAGGEGGAA